MLALRDIAHPIRSTDFVVSGKFPEGARAAAPDFGDFGEVELSWIALQISAEAPSARFLAGLWKIGGGDGKKNATWGFRERLRLSRRGWL